MVKQLLFVLLFMCSHLALAQTPPSSNLSAFVDRTDISVNDVFNLTIRVDAQLGNATPSFTGLDRDFEQLGISRTNTYTNNNGDIQSWNEFRVSLKPLSSGTLTIPSFRVGGQVTTPIAINVGDAPQDANGGNNEIFITTSVSKQDVYVQEQLLYTVKLYYTVGFDQGAQLTSPQVANSVVQQLGSDDTYQEIIEGIRYNVTERKFVVFPQSSGELTIPPVYFTATLGRRGGLSRILSNRSNIREVSLTSEAQIINVMPTPASFSGQTWLPSADFIIEESWSGPLNAIAIGESITRNIVITAAGLSSSLLPDFNYAEIADLKFYPDQPVREDMTDANGVIGQRAEGTAIVPSAAGEFILPAIEIPWWNTISNSLEIATIPAKTLTVVAGLGDASSALGQIAPGANQLANNAATPAAQTSGLYLYWIMATVFFAAAWLFSTVMWLRNRQMMEQIETPEFAPVILAGPSGNFKQRETQIKHISGNSSDLPDLSTSYRVLQRACEQSNLLYIKRSLITWGQAFFQNRSLITLDNLTQQAQSPELAANLAKLEQALYSEGEESESFPGAQLLKEVSSIQKSNKHKSAKEKTDYSLPPLYKN